MAWSKRMSAANAKERKTKGKFIVSSRGPHKKDESLPLLVVLRDNITLSETYKEGKHSIKRGELLVDGKACRDHKYGVGLMDTVHIPSANLSYRVVNGRKGIGIIKIPEKEGKLKICKIIGKTAVNGGKIQYNLHDGRNMILGEKYNTRDSLVISLPEQKVIEHLKFDEGNTGLITTGKNAGTVAKIEKIETGKVKRVWMKSEGGAQKPKVSGGAGNEVSVPMGTAGFHFEAPLHYVMIVGKGKPVISLKGEQSE